MAVTMRNPEGVEVELIKVIEEEIAFLQKCIKETDGGGWSTHLVSPMQDRVRKLMAVVYTYERA